MLLYFGAVILIITFVLFSLNQRVVATGRLDEAEQVLINGLFAIVALLLGFPYLLWVVWKRRDELIGREADYGAIARHAVLTRAPACGSSPALWGPPCSLASPVRSRCCRST